MRHEGSTPRDHRGPDRDDDTERGSLHVMTIPVALALVALAVLVIAMLGSATNDRRQAGTAADAAALAAAQVWEDDLRLTHAVKLPPNVFISGGGVKNAKGLFDTLDAVLGTPPLSERTEARMRDAAEEYAESNGAELTDLHIDRSRLLVTAEVRHEDEIPVAETNATSDATAWIKLSGGLCIGDEAGLGLRIEGECLAESDVLEEVVKAAFEKIAEELGDDKADDENKESDEDEDSENDEKLSEEDLESLLEDIDLTYDGDVVLTD